MNHQDLIVFDMDVHWRITKSDQAVSDEGIAGR